MTARSTRASGTTAGDRGVPLLAPAFATRTRSPRPDEASPRITTPSQAQLLTWLNDADTETETLRQLVRDASRLLSPRGDLSWSSDVKDWQRAAAPFVWSDR